MSRTVHKFVARSILKNVTKCNVKSKSKPTVCDFRVSVYRYIVLRFRMGSGLRFMSF